MSYPLLFGRIRVTFFRLLFLASVSGCLGSEGGDERWASADLQATETEGALDLAFQADLTRLRDLVRQARALPPASGGSSSTDHRLARVETAAAEADLALLALAAKAQQVSETDFPKPHVPGLIALADRAKVKAAAVVDRARELPAHLGGARALLLSLARAGEASADVARTAARTLTRSGTDAVFVSYQVIALAGSGQGTSLTTQSEARRIARDKSDLITTATRLEIDAVAGEATGGVAGSYADLVKQNPIKVASSGPTVLALEGGSAAVTGATDQQVPRVVASPEPSAEDEQLLIALVELEKSAGELAKGQAQKGASTGEPEIERKVAVKNFGTLSEGKKSTSAGLGAKAGKLKKPIQDVKSDAEATKGAAGALSKAGKAKKKRVEDAKKEKERTDTKKTVTKLSEIEEKTAESVDVEVKRLVLRSEVPPADKEELTALATLTKETAGLGKSEALRGEATTGLDAFAAIKNSGALGEGGEAAGDAVAAKSDRFTKDVQDTKTDAEASKGTAGAASKSGAASKKRVDDAKKEKEKPETKRTLKKLAEVKRKTTKSMDTEVKKLVLNEDVPSVDQDELLALTTLGIETADMSDAEAGRGEAETGPDAIEAIMNTGALGEGVEATAEVVLAKVDRFTKDVQDVKTDAGATKGAAGGASKAGAASKKRAEDVKRKRKADKPETKETLKKLAEVKQKTTKSVDTEVKKLILRGEVPQQDKTELAELAAIGIESAALSREETENAVESVGPDALAAILNSGALGEGIEGSSEVVAAKVDRFTKDVQDVKTDADATKGTAGGASKAGAATKKRAEDAKGKRQKPETKRTLKKLAEVKKKTSKSMDTEVKKLNLRGEVPPVDKEELAALAALAEEATALSLTEAELIEVDTGADAADATGNVGALGGGLEASGDAVAAKTDRLTKGRQGVKIDARAIKGVADAASKSGGASKGKVDDVKDIKKVRERSERKRAIKILADITRKNTGAMGTELSKLLGRPEVPAADKMRLQKMIGTAKKGADSSFAEADRADKTTGVPSQGATKNSGALGGGVGGLSAATSATVSPIAAPQADVEVEADASRAGAGGVSTTGGALQGRADETPQEFETAENKQTIRLLAEMQKDATDGLGDLINKLTGRQEVPQADKDRLQKMKDTLGRSANSSFTEAQRGETSTGATWKTATKNSGSLGGGISGLGTSTAAAAGHTGVPQTDVEIDAGASSVSSGGVSISGKALQARAKETPDEAESPINKQVIQLLAEMQKDGADSLRDLITKLLLQQISQVERELLEQMLDALRRGADTAFAEAQRGAQSTGATWKTATKNSGALGGGVFGFSTSTGATAGRTGVQQVDVQTESDFTSASSGGISRAGKALQERAKETPDEAESALSKEVIKLLAEMQQKGADGLEELILKLLQQQISQADKELLEEMLNALKRSASTSFTEAERGAQSTGATWKTATKNSGALGGGISGLGTSAAATSGQIGVLEPDVSTDSGFTRSGAGGVSISGSALEARAKETPGEAESALSKEVIKLLAEMQQKGADGLEELILKLLQQQISEADKQLLQEMLNALKRSASTSSTEAERGAQSSGATWKTATKNSGALGGGISGFSNSIGATAGRTGAPVLDVKTDSEFTNSSAGGVSISGRALQARAKETPGEAESALSKEVIKLLAEMQQKGADGLEDLILKLLQQQLSQADKQLLQEMLNALKRSASTSFIEAERGAQSNGATWKTATKNSGALGGGISGLGTSMGAVTGSTSILVPDVQTDSGFSNASSGGISITGSSLQERAKETPEEAESALSKEVIKLLAEMQKEGADSLENLIQKLLQQQLSQAKRDLLLQLLDALRRGAGSALNEALRGAQSTGPTWKAATKNSGALGGGVSGLSAATGASAGQTGASQFDVEADAGFSRSGAGGLSLSGAALDARAKETPDEPEAQISKDMIKLLAEMQKNAADSVDDLIAELLEQQLSEAKKELLRQMLDSMRRSADASFAEAERGAQSAGATWKTATKNSGALGGGLSGLSTSTGATAGHTGVPQSDIDADARFSRSSAGGVSLSGSALQARAKETPDEPESPFSKQVVQLLAEMMRDANDSLEDLLQELLQQQLSEVERELLEQMLDSLRRSSNTSFTEAQRGAQSTGATWQTATKNSGALGGGVSGLSTSAGATAGHTGVAQPDVVDDAGFSRSSAGGLSITGGALDARAKETPQEPESPFNKETVRLLAEMLDDASGSLEDLIAKLVQQQIDQAKKDQLEEMIDSLRRSAGRSLTEAQRGEQSAGATWQTATKNSGALGGGVSGLSTSTGAAAGHTAVPQRDVEADASFSRASSGGVSISGSALQARAEETPGETESPLNKEVIRLLAEMQKDASDSMDDLIQDLLSNPEVTDAVRQRLLQMLEAMVRGADTSFAEAQRGEQTNGTTWQTATRNSGALGGGVSGMSQASGATAGLSGVPQPDMAAEAETTELSAGGSFKVGAAMKGRAVDAKGEPPAMQSQQAMQLLAEMNGKTIDSMAAEIERLRQREELTAKERDELKELADAAKEAADASSKEAGEIGDLSRRRSKLERLEALNKASGASSGAVGAKSKPLKKVARDEGVDLKELEEVAQAVEDAADSSASQSKVETDLDTDTAALVTTMKALTRVSKATADSQSSAADRLTEAELAKKLAAAAKKSADDAKSKTDGLGTEVDKRKRLSKIAKKSDAARKSSSGVKIEVDRKREPKPDAEKTKKRIKGLKDATESNALAAIDEVKSLKEGSSDPTLGPELLRALTDASKGAADTADEDARYLLELLGEVNSTVQELTEASKAFADASAALAAAEATPSPTTLTKLGRLLDGSLASGLAATVEAERIARGGLTAPSPSISNVTRSAGAAQGVTDAVAAEVQRLRAEALGPLSAALLGAAVTAGVAATDSTVAEVGRLLWQSPWHGSGLRQRALAAQAAMRDVAKKAARFASGQGDTNANLAALDQAVRVAQTAGLAMTDEAVEMTVGSGSVGTSPANVGALLAATRAAVLSNTVESDRAADTGTSPSFGTASRLKAAADAAKTSSAALSAEAERMATALASNRGKALRLTSLAGSARQIGLELVAAAAPLGGGGGLPPATLQQIAELAGEGHVVVAVAGSEANQLEERDLSLAPPRRPRPRGW